MSRIIQCVGKVNNNGNLPIIEKGFVYSFTNTYPITGDTSCVSVFVTTPLNQLGEFITTISNLPETTPFYVNSFAKNVLGTSFSAVALTGITGGIINKPVITIKAISKILDIVVEAYEVGTTNQLVVSGSTILNDELTFNILSISQTSTPPVSNPIRTWTGLQRTFRTDQSPGAISVNFTPISSNPSSFTMTHNANYLCGQNPQYNITASTQTDAVFPYLWVLRSDFNLNASYFVPVGNELEYFYYKASSTPPPSAPKTNGKIVKPKVSGELVIDMLPITGYNRMVFGYPKSYGDNIQFKIGESGQWGTTTNIIDQSVSTGYAGGLFGIVNSWNIQYRIMFLLISGPPYSSKLFIRHV